MIISQLDGIGSLAQAKFLLGRWGMPKDGDYSTFAGEFILEAMDAWVRQLPTILISWNPSANGRSVPYPRWHRESGDCDNINADFLAYLNRCLWVDSVANGTPRGNAAAGTLFLQVKPGDPTSNHAPGWFIDHSRTARTFDAGLRQIDVYTRAQLETIFGGEWA